MKKSSIERVRKIKETMHKCKDALNEEKKKGSEKDRFLLQQSVHLLGGSIGTLEEALGE